MFLDISCVTITENNPVDAEIHEIIPSESVRYIGEYENKYEGNLPTNQYNGILTYTMVGYTITILYNDRSARRHSIDSYTLPRYVLYKLH